MSNEMIERVARAIACHRDGGNIHPNSSLLDAEQQVWTDLALTVIKAMREPTDPMRADGRDVIQQYLIGGRVAKVVKHQWQIADEVWQAMIDEAAGEGHENRNPA